MGSLKTQNEQRELSDVCSSKTRYEDGILSASKPGKTSITRYKQIHVADSVRTQTTIQIHGHYVVSLELSDIKDPLWKKTLEMIFCLLRKRLVKGVSLWQDPGTQATRTRPRCDIMAPALSRVLGAPASICHATSTPTQHSVYDKAGFILRGNDPVSPGLGHGDCGDHCLV